MTPARAVFAFVLLVVTIVGCTVLFDASDIDEGCRQDEKVCFERCVKISDPAYGCGTDPASCERPCTAQNAITTCDGGCGVRACLYGFRNCSDTDACADNVLFDRNHCGACDNRCADNQTCRDGVCVVE